MKGVEIAQSLYWIGYGLAGPGFESQQEQEIFLLQNLQTKSVGHPAPTPPLMVIGDSLPRGNADGRETEHLFSSSASVKSEWSLTTIPSTCLYNEYTENFFHTS